MLKYSRRFARKGPPAFLREEGFPLDHHITLSMEFMVKSHYELARTLAADRDSVSHTSRVISALPDHGPTLGEPEAALETSLEVLQTVAVYLNSLGDLEEALADQLEIILKQIPLAEGNE